MKPIYEITKYAQVGIYESQYVVKVYENEIIVVSPHIKWSGNTGSYAESRNIIKDKKP